MLQSCSYYTAGYTERQSLHPYLIFQRDDRFQLQFRETVAGCHHYLVVNVELLTQSQQNARHVNALYGITTLARLLTVDVCSRISARRSVETCCQCRTVNGRSGIYSSYAYGRDAKRV